MWHSQSFTIWSQFIYSLTSCPSPLCVSLILAVSHAHHLLPHLCAFTHTLSFALKKIIMDLCKYLVIRMFFTVWVCISEKFENGLNIHQ